MGCQGLLSQKDFVMVVSQDFNKSGLTLGFNFPSLMSFWTTLNRFLRLFFLPLDWTILLCLETSNKRPILGIMRRDCSMTSSPETAICEMANVLSFSIFLSCISSIMRVGGACSAIGARLTVFTLENSLNAPWMLVSKLVECYILASVPPNPTYSLHPWQSRRWEHHLRVDSIALLPVNLFQLGRKCPSLCETLVVFQCRICPFSVIKRN